mgnify:CR=1 FL=1|jgi:phage shock protein A
MKKFTQVLLVALLIITALAMAGCGEEEKYNKAKNAFLAAEQQLVKIDVTDITKHDALVKDLDTQIAAMQKIAVSETKLNNDLIQVKQKYEHDKQVWKDMKAEHDTIKKMDEDLKGQESGTFVNGFGKSKWQ